MSTITTKDGTTIVAAVPPIMVKSAANPEGLPMDVFDSLRSALAKDRSQTYKDFAGQFYGANRPGAQVSQGTLDQFWMWEIYYPGLSHGLTATHPDLVNRDQLAFCLQGKRKVA